MPAIGRHRGLLTRRASADALSIDPMARSPPAHDLSARADRHPPETDTDWAGEAASGARPASLGTARVPQAMSRAEVASGRRAALARRHPARFRPRAALFQSRR